MVAAIEQIQQELAALETKAAAIAQDLQRLYTHYLELLGQAVYQQLILASYHVCTQVYPEAFLELSLEKQQHLQTDFKVVGRGSKTQILDCLQPLTELLQGQDTEITPETLVLAHLQVEDKISREMQRVSRAANRLLEHYTILSATQVEIALKVISKEEQIGRGRLLPSHPHVITLMLEAPEDQDDPEAAITAIFLQLGEIEFGDPTVMVWRNQIRQQSQKLQELQQDYDQKQMELVIAQAEAAWRAIWVRD